MTRPGRLASFAVSGALALAAAATAWRCTHRPDLPFGPDRPDDKKTVGGPRRLTEDDLKAKDDVVGYARYCKQELGLPDATLAAWNCLEGTEIPITVDGVAPTDAVYADMVARKTGCDLPSWLGDEPCSNYAFVQRRDLGNGVDALLLCRMRSFSSAKDRATRLKDLYTTGNESTFRSYYQFDSLGLIWTSKTSGKTCYFDFVGPSYGGRVPSPDDERAPDVADLPDPKPPGDMAVGTGREAFWKRDARATWRSPKEVAARDNCVRCHDTGPYKASPWIGQVFGGLHNDPALPYSIVGAAFEEWRVKFPAVAVSTEPIDRNGTPEPQVCTSCHRIGLHATCERFVEHATGQTAAGLVSDRGKSFFYRTWMPPSPADWHGKAESELATRWTDANDRHVARLKCCCTTPDAKGCTTQRFDGATIAAPVSGKGPAICP